MSDRERMMEVAENMISNDYSGEDIREHLAQMKASIDVRDEQRTQAQKLVAEFLPYVTLKGDFTA